MLARHFLFIASIYLLACVPGFGGTTYYTYELEISPASVKLLEQRKPDQRFSETDLADLRFLVRTIAARHILKTTYTFRDNLDRMGLIFRDGFLCGVLTNFIRQQFEKSYWRLGPESNALKDILPVGVGVFGAAVRQIRRLFSEAPQAESTLMARLSVSKELILEKFEPFYHSAYGVTYLQTRGCQVKSRHLLYRLQQSGWFPGKVSSFYDPVFP